MRAREAGDAALLVETDGPAGALAAAIRAQRLPGVLDAIAGARTVLVVTEPGSWDLSVLASRMAAAPAPAAAAGRQPVIEIPVRYDGPDLAEVARLAGLAVSEVIARHAASEYTVGWLGFSPGFPYLTGLNPALDVPRLAAPRLRVPRGSVAIAGGLAAVYPTDSPGGWRLLGQTTTVLWDAAREPPALLAPGMRVRFRPVSELPVPSAPHQPRASLATPSLHDPGDFSAIVTEKSPGSWTAPAAPAAIEVVRPGPLATVQDLGRPALGHLGVPASGAADTASLRHANHLAGNPPGAAGIEFTLGKALLRFSAPAVVAVTGAAAAVMLAAAPGQPARAIEFGTAFPIPAGAELRIGTPAAGLRTYLAVRGGIDVPAVLGSRSADLLSRLGPAPLRAGDLLPVGGMSPRPSPGAPPDRPPSLPPDRPPSLPPGPPSPAGQAVTLRVLPGPRDDWFAGGAVGLLCAADYVVRPASDRTGLRLDGPVLPRAGTGEMASEGMVTGALQVPPDGGPILLLADHPVTGGYPVIAVVRSADIGLAAQLRPGQRVRFSFSR
jgi:KipI family sensor histidine kinase inhibitor